MSEIANHFRQTAGEAECRENKGPAIILSLRKSDRSGSIDRTIRHTIGDRQLDGSGHENVNTHPYLREKKTCEQTACWVGGFVAALLFAAVLGLYWALFAVILSAVPPSAAGL